MARKTDNNFLADAVGPRRERTLSYGDGFRFGIGLMIAGLLVSMVLGGVTWGAILLLHLS